MKELSARTVKACTVILHEKQAGTPDHYEFRKTCDVCAHHVAGRPCGEGDCRKHRPPWGRSMCAWFKEEK